jgi:DNA transposition AAA+ family ATPase
MPYTLTPTSLSGPLPNLVGDFEGVMAANYDAKTADVLRFWFFTARENGWNLTRLAKTTGVSYTTLYRLFRGEYSADAGNAAEKLIRARETFEDSADNPDFIDTSLAKRLFTILDKTRALRNVSIVWGKMGIGKSVCIGEYARRNPDRTSVVRFPAGATFVHFVQEVGRAVGVAKMQSAPQMRERITHILGMGQRLLIVDELHQAFLTTRTDCAVRCCEYLREVSDVSQCGMVLVGTELLEESIFRGPHKKALSQLVDRGTVSLSLPPLPTQQDIRQFLQAYGLDFPDAAKDPEAHAILTDIIKSAGLRKLTLHLRDGQAHANKRQETYQWPHFSAAFKGIQALTK